MRPVTSSRALEWVVPASAVLITVTLTVIHAGSMPNPVATHWSPEGNPSGPSRRDVELAMGVVVVMIGAAFTGLAERMPTVVHARMLIVTGHVASVAWAGQRGRLISANAGAHRWTETAPTLPVATIVILALLAGLIGWLVSAPRLQQGRDEPPAGGSGPARSTRPEGAPHRTPHHRVGALATSERGSSTTSRVPSPSAWNRPP